MREGADAGLLTWLHFYLNWRQGDAPACRALAAANPDNRWLQRDPQWSGALGARALVRALETNDAGGALKLLTEISGGRLEGPPVVRVLTCLVVWFLERNQAATAHRLLQILRQEGIADPRHPDRAPQLGWAVLALAVPVAARMGQYTGCIDSAQQVLAAPRRSRPSSARSGINCSSAGCGS